MGGKKRRGVQGGDIVTPVNDKHNFCYFCQMMLVVFFFPVLSKSIQPVSLHPVDIMCKIIPTTEKKKIL